MKYNFLTLGSLLLLLNFSCGNDPARPGPGPSERDDAQGACRQAKR